MEIRALSLLIQALYQERYSLVGLIRMGDPSEGGAGAKMGAIKYS